MKRPAVIMVLFGLGPIALLAIAIGTVLSGRIPQAFDLVLWPLLAPAALLISAVAWAKKSDVSKRTKIAFIATYSFLVAAAGAFNFHTITEIWAAI